MESILCWPAIPENGVSPGVGNKPNDTPSEYGVFPGVGYFTQWQSFGESLANSFLAGGEMLCPLLNSEILSIWTCVKFCVCCYSLCKFICVTVLLYLEYAVLTRSSLYSLSVSSSTKTPELMKYGIRKRHPILDWVSAMGREWVNLEESSLVFLYVHMLLLF